MTVHGKDEGLFLRGLNTGCVVLLVLVLVGLLWMFLFGGPAPE